MRTRLVLLLAILFTAVSTLAQAKNPVRARVLRAHIDLNEVGSNPG